MAREQSQIPTLSTEQWREDLQVFAKELTQRHKNPYHRVTKAEFEAAFSAFETDLPVLRDFEVVVGIERLTALIGDGHTRLDTGGLYHSFPVETFWFGNELRLLRTIPAYQEVLGARILKIGNSPVRKVHKRLQAIIPQGENRWFRLQQSAAHISRVEPLAALGILPEVDRTLFTFEHDAGKKFILEIEPFPANSALEWIDAQTNPPLYLQRRGEPFWFTYLPDLQTIYACFRGYENLSQSAEKLWAFLDRQNPRRLVIDMRQNGGGDYTQGRKHLVYKVQFRRTMNSKGNLFVVTGRGTFSAAMTNVIDFRRETDAIVVGEPTGARPNGYQELDTFILPNSGLKVFCSIFYYRFQDRDTPAVMPDKRIDPDWKAYQEGRDPIMEWILSIA